MQGMQGVGAVHGLSTHTDQGGVQRECCARCEHMHKAGGVFKV